MTRHNPRSLVTPSVVFLLSLLSLFHVGFSDDSCFAIGAENVNYGPSYVNVFILIIQLIFIIAYFLNL